MRKEKKWTRKNNEKGNYSMIIVKLNETEEKIELSENIKWCEESQKEKWEKRKRNEDE